MKKLTRLSPKTTANLALILLLCSAISCQPKAMDEIAEEEAAKATSNSSTESPVVGGIGLHNPPTLIKRVDPIYPKIARQANVEGSVILEVTTDIDGKVQKVKVLRSIPLLDRAAIDTVKQWVFEPLIIDSQRRGVILTVCVPFKLK